MSNRQIQIEEKNPLKQGLKHDGIDDRQSETLIEEKNPLKQGLKQNMETTRSNTILIEEKNPLKQGLKLCANKTIGILNSY